jgi:hypothetical protein
LWRGCGAEIVEGSEKGGMDTTAASSAIGRRVGKGRTTVTAGAVAKAGTRVAARALMAALTMAVV